MYTYIKVRKWRYANDISKLFKMNARKYERFETIFPSECKVLSFAILIKVWKSKMRKKTSTLNSRYSYVWFFILTIRPKIKHFSRRNFDSSKAMCDTLPPLLSCPYSRKGNFDSNLIPSFSHFSFRIFRRGYVFYKLWWVGGWRWTREGGWLARE